MADLNSLTKRESQVMDLLAHGYSRNEIGEMLHLARGTMISHTNRAYDKLGALGLNQGAVRVVAILKFLRQRGILPEDFEIREEKTK